MQSEEVYRSEIQLKAKRWKGLYPQYFDKNLSINQGRKISKNIAIPNVNIQEIALALKQLKLHAIVEPNKCYSKNWMVKGRIKVELFGEDGKPVNPQYKNKLALMKKIVEIIAQYPDRKENPEGKALHGTKEYSLALDFLKKTAINDEQEQEAPTKKEQKKKRRGK